jgi:hypothetical protein
MGASDASTSAYALLSIDAGGGQLPGYIAFDVKVASSCTATSSGTGALQLMKLEVGQGSNAANLYLEAVPPSFNLYPVTFFALDGAPYYPPQLPFSLPVVDEWIRLKLDLKPTGDVTRPVTVTISTGEPGNDEGCYTAFDGSATLVPPPPEAGAYDSNMVRIRLGLDWLSGSAPACQVYYDNFIVGAYVLYQ